MFLSCAIRVRRGTYSTYVENDMLDEVIIFRKTGLVLWEHAWVPIKGDPVNQLIQQVLLEVRNMP